MNAAGLTALFFHLVETAEVESRTAKSFLAKQAGLREFLYLTFKVEAKLGVHFRIDYVATEERAQTIE